MFKFINNLFSRNKNNTVREQTNTPNNTFLDILISLNHNFEIDLSLFIDCDYNKYNLSEIEYITICTKLINFDHTKVKRQLIDILQYQIKNKDNENFINNLILVLQDDLANDEYKKHISKTEYNQLFIKPSQVFTKNIHEHQ